MTKQEARAFLNIGENASSDQVKSAYRKLVFIYHPDSGGSNEDFLKLQNAYEVLTNKVSESSGNSSSQSNRSWVDDLQDAVDNIKFDDFDFKTDGSFAEFPRDIDVNKYFNIIIQDPHSIAALNAINFLRTLPFHKGSPSQVASFAREVRKNITSTKNVEELIHFLINTPYYVTYNPYSKKSYKSIEFTNWYNLDETGDEHVALEVTVRDLYEFLIKSGMTLDDLIESYRKTELSVQLKELIFVNLPVKYGLIQTMQNARKYEAALTDVFQRDDYYDVPSSAKVYDFLFKYKPELINELTPDEFVKKFGYSDYEIVSQYVARHQLTTEQWLDLSHKLKHGDSKKYRKARKAVGFFGSESRSYFETIYKQNPYKWKKEADNRKRIFLSNIGNFLLSNPTQDDIGMLKWAMQITDWEFRKHETLWKLGLLRPTIYPIENKLEFLPINSNAKHEKNNYLFSEKVKTRLSTDFNSCVKIF